MDTKKVVVKRVKYPLVAVQSFFEMTIQVYENLYNQELETRKDYDQKLSSRLTILTAQTALLGILSKWFVDNYEMFSLESVLFAISIILIFVQMVFFYKAFFRTKKTYKEVAVEEIRMFHLYSAQEKLKLNRDVRYRVFSNNEVELLTYLKDSYLQCAFHNMKINLKRGTALIRFDNSLISSIVLLLLNFILIYLKGDISWFQ